MTLCNNAYDEHTRLQLYLDVSIAHSRNNPMQHSLSITNDRSCSVSIAHSRNNPMQPRQCGSIRGSCHRFQSPTREITLCNPFTKETALQAVGRPHSREAHFQGLVYHTFWTYFSHFTRSISLGGRARGSAQHIHSRASRV